MTHLDYRDDTLHVESVAVEAIADAVGTPCYVYGHARLVDNVRRFEAAFAGVDHLTCYSVKANSTLAIVAAVTREGLGCDVVSGGELERALRAGADPTRIVFSGAGKTDDEIDAALRHGIRMLNAESRGELERIDRVATRRGVRAPVSVRINPDVDAKTHRYVTTGLRENKFGVDAAEALDVYAWASARPGLAIRGVDCHIGSNIRTLEPFAEAMRRMRAFIETLRARGIAIDHCDVGGGLGIPYDRTPLPSIEDYAHTVIDALDPAGLGVELLLEPGRILVGDIGLLVCTVLYVKRHGERTFVIVDGAMNDFMRPCLYEAHHEIVPITRRGAEPAVVDVVGPVCETTDFFALDRAIELPRPGDRIAVLDVGAYGFGLASNFNSRPRAPEVLVRGREYIVVRRRESFDDLVRGERIPDFLA